MAKRNQRKRQREEIQKEDNKKSSPKRPKTTDTPIENKSVEPETLSQSQVDAVTPVVEGNDSAVHVDEKMETETDYGEEPEEEPEEDPEEDPEEYEELDDTSSQHNSSNEASLFSLFSIPTPITKSFGRKCVLVNLRFKVLSLRFEAQSQKGACLGSEVCLCSSAYFIVTFSFQYYRRILEGSLFTYRANNLFIKSLSFWCVFF